ncbi:GNAT family N-acetyltransferase [Microlunatus soli]|uniref:Protein N-acetyltransferase, RimJ/RimL family n=1 Tax=Microlunatus soli TaxID=630515 RepID=A0A1H1W6C9_9ACTN|nr:GNAT family protein [Microlunatus soli]SDS92615.1 Protein N-acetyltransferase, RimJ/RimL family [Microlunatus soli]
MDSEPFRDKPTLTGERVVLRPFGVDDVPIMAEILADPELLRLTGSVHSSDETGEPDDRLRQWYGTRQDHADRLDLALVDRAHDRLVGEVVLNELDPDNDSCNIRILIGPQGRDRGLGTEAMRLMVDHAFSSTDLYRLELGVFAFNPRAVRVYEKVGFVVEGTRRAAFRFDDQRIDDVMMSIIRPEWVAAVDDGA